jgi:hypothetical protein
MYFNPLKISYRMSFVHSAHVSNMYHKVELKREFSPQKIEQINYVFHLASLWKSGSLLLGLRLLYHTLKGSLSKEVGTVNCS